MVNASELETIHKFVDEIMLVCKAKVLAQQADIARLNRTAISAHQEQRKHHYALKLLDIRYCLGLNFYHNIKNCIHRDATLLTV